MKFLKRLSISILLIGLLLFAWGYYHYSTMLPDKAYLETTDTLPFSAKRFLDTALIDVAIHPTLQAEAAAMGYTNINGPTLIRVPDWVKNPLGKYYLYFSHHKGENIRMAYANSLTGQWQLYEGDIMPLAQSTFATEAQKTNIAKALWTHNTLTETVAIWQVGQHAQKAYKARTQQKIKSSPPTTPHVASPEILIDHENQEIRLYFHGVVEDVLQKSKVAISSDGLNFTAQPEIITLPYLRMFKHKGEYFGFTMPGFFYRSTDGLTNFKVRHQWLFDVEVRHSGLHIVEDDLYIFYSKVGDTPERIFYTKVDISSDNWNDWTASPSQELLQSELDWEGVHESIQPSIRGEMGTLVHQLRDPFVFKDEDGQLYLLYTGGGEQNIGIVELI